MVEWDPSLGICGKAVQGSGQEVPWRGFLQFKGSRHRMTVSSHTLLESLMNVWHQDTRTDCAQFKPGAHFAAQLWNWSWISGSSKSGQHSSCFDPLRLLVPTPFSLFNQKDYPSFSFQPTYRVSDGPKLCLRRKTLTTHFACIALCLLWALPPALAMALPFGFWYHRRTQRAFLSLWAGGLFWLHW